MAQTKLKGKQVETFTDTTEGVVPASGGGTTNFLRADGTWATPAGGGGTQNVFIQESEPTEITPFIWFKTNTLGKIIDIRQNI